jgi:hypothetical protein
MPTPNSDTISTDKQQHRYPLTGLLMLGLMGLILLGRMTGISLFDSAAHLVTILLVILGWRVIGLREIYLLSSCVILSGLAYYLLGFQPIIYQEAFAQAAFLMAFLLILSLLHEAAMTSPSVAECGQFLTRQRAGRRFAALFLGSNFMAVLFNLGLVSILTPLIQKGIEQDKGNPSLMKLREQRQVTAMLRGFAWCVVWSPTAIAPLAVFELIDGISRQLWTAYGIVFALVMFGLGWAEDQWRFRNIQRQPSSSDITPFPSSAFLRFGIILAILFGMAVILSILFHDTIVFGLLISCPLVMLGWLYRQTKTIPQKERFPAFVKRLDEISFIALPKNHQIMITLAASGFIGRIGAGMIPAEDFANALGLYHMPDYMFLSLLSIAMIPVSYLGVSPIMMAVFFGSILGALPILPADPTLVALAISSGWAVSMTTSPFATVVLMISRLNNISPLHLTLRWSGVFSVLALCLISAMFFVITGGT